MENLEAYGIGGLEYIDQNTPITNLRNSEVLKKLNLEPLLEGLWLVKLKKKL